MFIIILFDIKQLNKLWKKTFKNIHQLSCFVGHLVVVKRLPSKIFDFLKILKEQDGNDTCLKPNFPRLAHLKNQTANYLRSRKGLDNDKKGSEKMKKKNVTFFCKSIFQEIFNNVVFISDLTRTPKGAPSLFIGFSIQTGRFLLNVNTRNIFNKCQKIFLLGNIYDLGNKMPSLIPEICRIRTRRFFHLIPEI